MIAALATLVFLSSLWLLVVLGAAVFEASGAKILSALRGRTASPMIATRPVRMRGQRYQTPRPARISVRQRAAA
jgi:hypothetical protein